MLSIFWSYALGTQSSLGAFEFGSLGSGLFSGHLFVVNVVFGLKKWFLQGCLDPKWDLFWLGVHFKESLCTVCCAILGVLS